MYLSSINEHDVSDQHTIKEEGEGEAAAARINESIINEFDILLNGVNKKKK